MTAPSEHGHEHGHDGVVEVRVSWWLTVGIGAMVGLGLAWYITREQETDTATDWLSQRQMDNARTRAIVRDELARIVQESEAAEKTESDEDKVL